MINKEYIEIQELVEAIIDNRGKTVPTSENGIPLIATNCIKHSSIFPTFENIRYINQETYDNWFRAHLKPNDILFVNKGTPGRCCIVPDPVNFVAAQDMVGLRFKKHLNPYYMLAVLRSKEIQNTIENNHVGLVIAHFRKQELVKLKLPILEETVRNKIGDFYEIISKKIELNNRINAELEAMAKTLYDYWFVQFDFPNSPPLEGWQNSKNFDGVVGYKSSGGKMVYNETLKREIPEGWEVKTVGDYCKSTGGFAFKSSWWTDNGMPVVKIKDIQEDYTINLSGLAFVDISDKNIDDKFKAKPGDVLIAMTGATVGKYAIVPYTEKPLYVNQRVGYFNLGIKPEKKLPFLINSLNQKYFRESVFTLASGAAQPNISNEQINNIQLLLPSKEIIELYNKVFEPYYSKILLNQKQNQELSALRDWLLPMLMNGQVKVG